MGPPYRTIAKIASVRNYGGVATTNEEIAGRVKALLKQYGVDQKTLAQWIGVDASGLSRALSGERAFKAREIALIAEILNVSTSAILEGAPAVTPSPVRVAARRSVDDDEVVHGALSRAAFFQELATLVGSKSSLTCQVEVDQRTDLTPWAQGEWAAELLLEQTGLGDQALPQGMHKCAELVEETLGIQVTLESLGTGLDGLSIDCDRFQMAIVSTSTAPARQRWTLAHEVGHLVMGDTADVAVDRNVWASRSAPETRANAFAAAFLMPKERLKEVWGQGRITDERVAEALDVFQVSLDALAFRLHNVRCVNAKQRDLVRSKHPFISMLRNQATRQADGTWLPSRLTRDAVAAYLRGDVGVRWLAELVQAEPEDLLESIGSSSDEVEAMEAGRESVATG